MITFKNIYAAYSHMEKEVSESERKLLVRRKYLNKISEMLKQPYIEQKDLFILIKDFFSEYLKLEYEFTYEELSGELNKIYIKQALKNDIDNFLYELSESQYFTEKDMDHKEITENIKKLQSIIMELIFEESEPAEKKPTFLERIFKKSKDTKKKSRVPPATPPEVTPEMRLSSIAGIQKAEPTNEDMEELLEENIQYKKKMFTGEEIPTMPQMNIISDIPDLPKMEVLPEKKTIKEKKEIKEQPQKKKEKLKEKKEALPEKNILVEKGYSLLVEDNNPDMIGVREHLEESYNKMFNNKLIEAKEAYLKALDIYHRLEFSDKEKVYQALYELFKELKSR